MIIEFFELFLGVFDFFSNRKERKESQKSRKETEIKLEQIENKIAKIEEEKDIEWCPKPITVEDIMKVKDALGYVILGKKDKQYKLYFTDYNQLNIDLNEWVYSRGFRIKKVFVVGVYPNLGLTGDSEVSRLKNIISTYGGYVYMSCCHSEDEPLFLQRREIVRGKTNYYEMQKEHNKEMEKLFEKLGIKVVKREKGDNSPPTELEMNLALSRERAKHIEGYIMHVK